MGKQLITEILVDTLEKGYPEQKCRVDIQAVKHFRAFDGPAPEQAEFVPDGPLGGLVSPDRPLPVNWLARLGENS